MAKGDCKVGAFERAEVFFGIRQSEREGGSTKKESGSLYHQQRECVLAGGI